MAKAAKGALADTTAKAAPQVAAKAVAVLRDPKVQELILEHRDEIIDAAKRWGASVDAKVLGKLGQRGLERRAANGRQAVADLSKGSSALATALRPVTTSLDEVDRMLVVSAALPFAKRKKAHMKIDDVLDDLEKGLFEAAHPGTSADQET